MNTDNNFKKQHIYLEVLRVIAILLVIFNHTGKKGFFYFAEYPWGSAKFWLYMAASINCKLAVPLFFAISGALLLGKKEETFSDLYKKKIFRITAVLVIYSFMYYLLFLYQKGRPFHLSEFFFNLWDNNWNFSFWYLYAYLAFLISLPLLRVLACNMEKKHFFYMIFLYVLFYCILPIGQYLLWKGNHNLNENLRVKWILGIIVLHPLTGYYLHNHWQEMIKKGKDLIALWGVNIMTLMLGCYMTYLRAVNTGVLEAAHSQQFHKTFAFVNMITVFLTVAYLFNKYENRIPNICVRIIQSVGGCVFGIYLWHVFLLKNCDFIGKISYFVTIQCGMGQMVSTMLACLAIFLGAFLITWIQKRIPVLKNLV